MFFSDDWKMSRQMTLPGVRLIFELKKNVHRYNLSHRKCCSPSTDSCSQIES